MSIAVSAVVVPSRLLRSLTLAACTGAVLIGLWLVWPTFENLPTQVDRALLLRAGLALACIAAGLHVARRSLRARPPIRIDISGNGQIRMERVDAAASVPGDACFSAATRWQGDRADCPAAHRMQGPLTLLPESTLWSCLMVLRLQCALGHIHTLFVLPDTVSDTSFRMLSVACHWIAAHNNRAGSENT